MNIWLKKGLFQSSILYFLFSSGVSLGQVIPDNTLPINSSVTSDSKNTIVNNGTQVGHNLFHSFQQFSVPTGGTVYFNNSPEIQNIFSRITGNSVSSIDGLIRANGASNLFLLNPNGIIFGSKARLDLGGSFLASTASSVEFADGARFAVNSPQSPPLLTVNVPIGLNFGSSSGEIRVQGEGHSFVLTNPIFSLFDRGNSSRGLEVQPSKTLALIGGHLTLEGGILTAEQGRIELGSVNSGQVQLNSSISGWDLSYKGVKDFQNIDLTQKALVFAGNNSNSSIWVQGANIKLADGAVILLQNSSPQTSGNLNINALESLEINGTNSFNGIPTGLNSQALGSGNGGDIQVSTKKLSVTNSLFAIASTTFNLGKGGNIFINAFDSVEIATSSTIPLLSSDPLAIGLDTVGTGTYSFGQGGDLSISTKNFHLTNRVNVGTGTYSSGKGGNLTISAENLNISDRARPGSQSLGSGDGGDVVVFAGNLNIESGGLLGTASSSSGKGGDVTINVSGSTKVIGKSSTFFEPSVLQAAAFSTGDAGKLTINTSRLIVRDGGRVDTATVASGNAGDLTIKASDSIEVSGTFSNSVSPSLIDSSASVVDLKLQQLLRLPSLPSGNSGNVVINTRNLNITNSGLISVKNDGTGDAGTLQINAKSIDLDKQGSITASTAFDQGGVIDLQARNLQLRNGSTITATAGTIGGTGNGGNISLKAPNLQLRNNSTITATAGIAGGTGNGGNITLNTDILTAVKNSDITANAFQGRGGNIQIETQGLFLSPNSNITASSQRGINGIVQFNSTIINPSNGLLELPAQVIDDTKLIVQGCPVETDPNASSFVVTGRGGLPDSPYAPLKDRSVWVDLRPIGTSRSTGQSRTTTVPTPEAKNSVQDQSQSEALVEASSWAFNSKGEVMLTASIPNVAIDVPWLSPTSCTGAGS